MDFNKIKVEDCVVHRNRYGYTEVPQKYLFIDFDGTIRKAVDNSNPSPGYAETYKNRPPFAPSEVNVFKVMYEKLVQWYHRGYKIIGITNQSGVEGGAMNFNTCVETCVETVRQTGLFFPVIFAPCKEKGSDEVRYLRKPNPGMIDLAERIYGPADRGFSLMVGDYKTDIETGKNARIKTILVDSSKEGEDFPLPF